ncbi:MAG: cytochrome P450 [Chloroflexota bacterium]
MMITHKKIPEAPALPFVGSALQIFRSDLHTFVVKQWRQHGSVFRMQIMGARYLVLAGPEANAFFTKHELDYFTSHEVFAAFAKEVEAKHFIAAMDGPDHTRARAIIKKPYSPRELEKNWAQLWEFTDNFFETHCEQRQPLFPLMQKLVANQIGMLVLGTIADDYLEDLSVFLTTLIAITLGIYPPFMLKRPRYIKAKERVIQYARDIIADHKVTTRENPDIVDYLLDAQKTHPEFMSDDELIISTIGPYLAGIDTAAGTLGFLLYTLTKYELQEKVKEELRNAGELTAQTVRKLPVLHGWIAETMRLLMSTPVIPRSTRQAFEFEGVHIPAGEKVLIATGVAHFSEQFYKNPDIFDIERCMPPRNEHRQAGAFVPYGIGSHTCAGAGFANVQIAATMACLLNKWRVESNEKLRLTNGGAIFPSKHLVGVLRRD